MFFTAPIIIILILKAIGFAVHLTFNEKVKKESKYNAGASFIAALIDLGLLYWHTQIVLDSCK